MIDPNDYQVIVDIIRVLLPSLKKMAEKTGNPHDDFVVDLMSRLVGEPETPDIIKKI